MSYYYGRKRIPIDCAFTTDDYQYPAEWLRHSTREQREEIGITEEENPNLRKVKLEPPVIDNREKEETETLTRFILSAILNMSPCNDVMTVEEVKAEVQLLDLNNIRKYPCSRSKMDDFYSMWQRFGPDAARTAMIPYLWDGRYPRPSEYFGLELNA